MKILKKIYLELGIFIIYIVNLIFNFGFNRIGSISDSLRSMDIFWWILNILLIIFLLLSIFNKYSSKDDEYEEE